MHPFTEDVLCWYDQHKRDLPWRNDVSPYRTLVSEVMLQQTRVETVIPYFIRFMESFPTIEALAKAEIDLVVAHWSGLGYYSRAKNLHKAAQQVVAMGAFPSTYTEILQLSGVGEYIAAAIASICFGESVSAIDANLFRVCSRIACHTGDRKTIKPVIDAYLPEKRAGDFNQALMDVGSRFCVKTPKCTECPFQQHCSAFATNRTDAFPILPKKNTKNTEEYLGLVVEVDGTMLFGTRYSSGLYANMSEPWLCLLSSQAMVETTEQEMDSITPVDFITKFDESFIEHASVFAFVSHLLHHPQSKYIGHFKHVLTHKILHIRVVYLSCSASDLSMSTNITENTLVDDMSERNKIVEQNSYTIENIVKISCPNYQSNFWCTPDQRMQVGVSSLASRVLDIVHESKNIPKDRQLSLF